MTQGQVNTLQAFSVQLIIIFIQQFYIVIPVYFKSNYNKCVTKRVLFYNSQFNLHAVISSVILTTTVNHSLISDHKEF
jgi:hypothetical protein